jgi:hypothetical protein
MWQLGYKGWPLAIEVSKIILRGKVGDRRPS